MTMMNLLAYHMLFIQENQPDEYTVAIDRNLVAGIPDAYHYAARFLRQLRLYNGKDGAFTVIFATAANFDSPIQGALKPVEGAARTKSACGIQVKQDGEMQELEMAEAEAEEQLGAEHSISELEQMLPAEFTARMRVFSADIASRLPKVCKVLETSSYDDLTNTDDVLSRVMDQTGDYGLEWGIFNFYNVFAMGDRDNTFSFEKEGDRDFSDPDGPSYRIDEQYEEYADGDPDFQPDEFPKQLAERIRGITEEEIYRELLEQAAEAQNKGYNIVDKERIRLEKQKETLKNVPFDSVESVKITGSTFVLTGEFEHDRNDREAIKAKIQAKGGRVTGAISGKTDYLVIGSYGGFGDRKIDQVKEQRDKGKDLKIIREEDLFAALEGKTVQTTAPKPSEAPKKKAAEKGRNQKKPDKQTEEDVEAAVQKAIDETKQEILEQEASMQQIQQARAAEEGRLKSLGFFKFSQKAASRERIAQLDRELADQQQKLQSMKAARLAKVRNVLSQCPQPKPTELLFRTAGASQATQEKAEAIASVLYTNPMTPEEINRALGTDYTALQIANAAAF